MTGEDAKNPEAEVESHDFIREIVERDLAADTHGGKVITRFPPEPNGYLHIGHAKAICVDFGVASDYSGVCHLRFDDTNPTTEDTEFVDSIQNDIRWLGFDWNDKLFFASDHFEKLYEWAEKLITDGNAYVCSLSETEMREFRGTVMEAGRASPYRDRSRNENLDLFRRMRKGEFADGEHTLRAKIDMAAPNMKLRDPPLYRIRHAHHYRTGDEWPIYPMYDYAHSMSDALEGITHSLCTLEFENNRALYDWLIETSGIEHRPRQYEFARLALTYTVTSKRKLKRMVEEKLVQGWDDPRMPTLAGMRRRGVTPSSIRSFCDRIGVAKANSTVDIANFEHTLREDLNHKAPRVLCVLDPLKVVVTNYPEGQSENLEGDYWPHDIPKEGTRKLPFGRELYIERSDFMESPPKKYKRLSPGAEVRLRYAYVIRCDEVVVDANGAATELHCTYDPETGRGGSNTGKKVKGTIHWVSAEHALPVEVRLYDRLFTAEKPDHAEGDLLDYFNRDSLEVVQKARAEPSLANGKPGELYQFERHGYFTIDPDSAEDALVFNRTVSLRDSWAKVTKKSQTVAAPIPVPTPKSKSKSKSSQPAPPKQGGARSPQQEKIFERFRDLGLNEADAGVLAFHAELLPMAEMGINAKATPEGMGNWLVNELLAVLKERPLDSLALRGAALGELVAMQEDDRISSKIAKKVFAILLDNGGAPSEIVKSQGWEQVSDEAQLQTLVDNVLAAHPSTVETYRGGKTSVLGFLVGQVMRESRGTANPEAVSRLLLARLQ